MLNWPGARRAGPQGDAFAGARPHEKAGAGFSRIKARDIKEGDYPSLDFDKLHRLKFVADRPAHGGSLHCRESRWTRPPIWIAAILTLLCSGIKVADASDLETNFKIISPIAVCKLFHSLAIPNCGRAEISTAIVFPENIFVENLTIAVYSRRSVNYLGSFVWSEKVTGDGISFKALFGKDIRGIAERCSNGWESVVVRQWLGGHKYLCMMNELSSGKSIQHSLF